MTSVPHSGAKSVTPGGSVAGHTPGPWSVAYLDDNGQSVVKGEHTEIATCWHHCVGSIEAQMHANARLIAAAPDLLAALQGAIGALEFSQDYHRDLGNEDQAFAADRLDDARAAIAKATAGETRNAEPIHRRDGDAEGGGVNPS